MSTSEGSTRISNLNADQINSDEAIRNPKREEEQNQSEEEE